MPRDRGEIGHEYVPNAAFDPDTGRPVSSRDMTPELRARILEALEEDEMLENESGILVDDDEEEW